MDFFLAALSGVLLTLSFPSYSFPFLGFVALVPLGVASWQKGKGAFRYGYLTGIIHFFSLLWWLVPTMATYGSMPSFVSWPVLGLLVCYLGLYPGLWAVLTGAWSQKNFSFFIVPALAAWWVLLEWIRGHLLSGFPWGLLGYSLVEQKSLLQSAEIWGVYGLSFLLALTNCIVFFLLKNKSENRWKKGAAAAGLAFFWLFLHWFGVNLMAKQKEMEAKSPKLTAVVVQGSIPQTFKWSREYQEKTIEIYSQLSLRAKDKYGRNNKNFVYVWPETALPFHFERNLSLQKRVTLTARVLNAPLLTGSPAVTYDGRGVPSFYNRVYLLSPQGKIVGKYDKRHLVPFGEYMPWGIITAWAKDFLPSAGEFQAGCDASPLNWHNMQAGILICFESIFPKLALETVRKGANMLTVVTNDAWFGRTSAPYQHEAMAVLRAVETRRWVVRAANTGISSIISPWGERTASTSLFEPAFNASQISLRPNKTFFVQHGDSWLVIFWLVTIIWGGYRRKK